MFRERARKWKAARDRAQISDLANRVIDERLTYLAPRKIRNLEWAMEQLQIDEVPGALVETGVALGGSAVILAAQLDRDFHGYDVFGMIPPPGPNDPPAVHERYATISQGRSKGIAGDDYYGYRHDLYEHVTATLARFGAPVGERVRLHQGLFEETLHPTGPIALAHIDCDWYEPVKLSLERIYPHLSPHGFLIGDDYFDYGGAQRAFDEFVRSHPDLRRVIEDKNLVLRRS